MKQFSEQFYKKSQSVKLEATEREALRERVVTYMEYHPLPVSLKQASGKIIERPLVGSPYQTVRVPFAMLLKWSAALSALVLIVVPVLAEKAVPGDTLYAIKVRFNEELRATLTLSPVDKVEWETERLNRRLAEARLLASEGRLTDEAEAEVAAAVRQHTENAKEEIEAMRASDADQAVLASIELNTTLELQSSSLQGNDGTTIAMKMSTEERGDAAQRIAMVLNEGLTIPDTNASATVPAFEKIMARVENNTTRAHELLNSLNLPEDDRLRVGIDRRLQDVNRSIEKANALRGTSDEAARQHLLGALQRTKKLIVYLNDIEVGKNLDLETIVPTIPTVEEEGALILSFTKEIEEKAQLLEEAEPFVTTSLKEKISVALSKATEAHVAIGNASEFSEKERLAQETIALLADTLLQVEAEGVDLTAPLTPADPLSPLTPATSSVQSTRR